MREIKFRVWDKGLKEMIYFDLKSANDTVDCQIYEDIMQYTNLKDKNGKEIYEGDVVQFQADVLDDGSFGDSLEPKYFVLAEVIFKASAFRFEYCGNAPLAHSLCEIIGNIYENPELLKGDKS